MMAFHFFLGLLRFAEICIGLVWLGLELFGLGQRILRDAQTAVVILLYVALSIACFGKFFGDIFTLTLAKRNQSFVKVIRVIARILALVGRVVLEIVLIWTGVNALESKKQRAAYFAFALSAINLLLIIMSLAPQKCEQKQKPQARAKAE